MFDFSYLAEPLAAQPMFGIVLTLFAYAFGVWLSRRVKSPLVNPMLVALVLVIAVLLLFRIPYASYQSGGAVITLFLAPSTAVLAVKIYEQFQLLKENWLPVLIGCAVGSAASILCVVVLCRLFFLDSSLLYSLLPKSVTTAIAIPLAEESGGIAAVTVAAVVLTGIMGAVFAPFWIRMLRITNPVEAGLAIGVSSHALGTSKAIEIGDVEGAMSGIALGVAGLITVIYVTFLI